MYGRSIFSSMNIISRNYIGRIAYQHNFLQCASRWLSSSMTTGHGHFGTRPFNLGDTTLALTLPAPVAAAASTTNWQLWWLMIMSFGKCKPFFRFGRYGLPSCRFPADVGTCCWRWLTTWSKCVHASERRCESDLLVVLGIFFPLSPFPKGDLLDAMFVNNGGDYLLKRQIDFGGFFFFNGYRLLLGVNINL